MRWYNKLAAIFVLLVLVAMSSQITRAQSSGPNADLRLMNAGICLVELTNTRAVYRSWARMHNPSSLKIRGNLRFIARLESQGASVPLYPGDSPYVDMTYVVEPYGTIYIARTDTFRIPSIAAMERWVKWIWFSSGVLQYYQYIDSFGLWSNGYDPNMANNSFGPTSMSPYYWCPGYGPASAIGHVFIDKNGNGRRDPGETGIKGAIVQLWQGSTLKARSTVSWPTGSFSIKPPIPGTYSISAIVPASSVGGSVLWTTPRAYYGISLSGGGTRGPFYFGVRPAPPSPPKAYYSSPTLRIETTPRHPVVIGQDPTERGADISVVVISPPALFEWYEWDDTQGKYVKRQERVPVPVVPGSVELYGSMTAASQDWVHLDLAARYPGASVRKGEWDMARDVGLRVVENRTLADGTTILRATAFRVPFTDPGTYTLRASARVRSVTHAKTGLAVPQRTVSGSGTVHVYVKDSVLR